MRFPFGLTLKIAGHILNHKIRRTPKFALVLQLEPLHTCNLSCAGCGRVREYSTRLQERMTLADCLAAACECNAPMVSVCGGEPLLYPQLEELVAGLLDQKRIVYICTNGLLMRQKLRETWARRFTPAQEPLLAQLEREGLVRPAEAAQIRQGRADDRPALAPHARLFWNVHVDGLERTHDAIVERPGVFRECVAAIQLAKALGYQVATNTTVYKETDPDEIEQMFALFAGLGVDGHTISPGYDYDAAKQAMLQRGHRRPDEFFLTRQATHHKFTRIHQWSRRFVIYGTPVYQEFLAGERDLTCTAWAIPTRNIQGWKAPCYLITDAHYPSYQAMLDQVDWDRYGVVAGQARDPRCQECMVHCGYDPSGALGVDYQKGDLWKNVKYNFAPRPALPSAKPL